MLTRAFDRLSVHRLCMLAFVALGGLAAITAEPAWAGDCGCTNVCVECPPDACDCPCDCGPRVKWPKPIYKALDAVAGGIEKVLGLDKIHCGPGCDAGCDEVFCDDGCDAATLYELSQPSEPQYFHQPQPIAPAAPVHQAPRAVPAPPAYRSHDLYPSDSQAPRMQMRMGEPSFSEPQPMHQPQTIAPPVHPQESLPNPFLDDARVTSKRRVRPTSYHQSEGQPKRKASPNKTHEPRYSRNDAPSEQLARTVR